MPNSSGGLLSDVEVKARLTKGEIFRPGSWSPDNFRGAAYDLRMATDLMVVPDPPTSPSGRRYRRGENRTNEVILNPGDVAFVSTVERLCLPWDIAANLGAKFGLTAKGVLILTGMCVDPGYGLAHRKDDETFEWIPKQDQRLHLLLANVGPRPIVLIPGTQRIATIQFFQVSEPEVKAETHSLGYQGIEEEFFDAQGTDAGLVFFRDMAEVRSQVKTFQQQIEQYNSRLTSVESGSNQVVIFGIYILSATLLGVSFAAILSIISNLKNSLASDWSESAMIFIGALFLGWIAGCIIVFFFIRRFMKKLESK
jgi:deoxycytidine triphosphate deaminase